MANKKSRINTMGKFLIKQIIQTNFSSIISLLVLQVQKRFNQNLNYEPYENQTSIFFNYSFFI